MAHYERLIDGVFEGGGVKGLAHIGALEELEARGYWFKRVAGASAGAWIAALIACGYRASPSHNCSLRVIMTLDHAIFHDGWLQLPRNLVTHGGLFVGRRLTDTLDALLKKGLGLNPQDPSPTFADLKGIELHIVASCLTSQDIIIFNRGTTPDLSIAEAVRMSSSLPFFYIPHEWMPSGYYKDSLKMTEKQLVIDGGVVSTFPMFIFKEQHTYVPGQTEEDRARPTIGFMLVEDEKPELPLNEHQERKRRAKPIRGWASKLIRLVLIVSFVFGYAYFLLDQVINKNLLEPIWGDESLFAPLHDSISGLPAFIRRTIYFIAEFFISVPRLIIVFLPIIILVLALNRPWRLLWQITGLVNIGFDKKHIHSEDVMEIYVGPYTTWRFHLSADQREDLIQRGRDALPSFLSKWEARYGLVPGQVVRKINDVT